MSTAHEVMRAVIVFERMHHRSASIIKLGYEEYKNLCLEQVSEWKFGPDYKTFNGITVKEVPQEHHLSVE